jgi:peptidoglycan/xylan/chitin deacetylase (PgdA/CDA1 family)
MSDVPKRSVKLCISMIFLAACSVRNIFRRLAGRPEKSSVILLYYHSIPADQRVSFARQMDTLRRWTRPLAADFRSVPANGGRFAAVTFDDGFVSFVEQALPELETRGIPATLFVVTEKLGCYPDWPEYILPDPLHREPILTAAQLLKIPDSITIGSHTLTHPTMTQISEAEAKRELIESRIQLEKLLGRKIGLFSFPHGDFNEDLIRWSREAGYERVFTILPTLAFADDFVMGRVWANPTDWPLEFLLKLLGAYRWLPLAFTWKRKLLAPFAVQTRTQWLPRY